MSQHLYQSDYRGQPVTILMGWDRPLQGFFMVIELQQTEGYVYCNLDDPELLAFGGFADNLDHFGRKLAELGLSVPPVMIEQIENDAAGNVGNRHVIYGCDGQVRPKPDCC